MIVRDLFTDILHDLNVYGAGKNPTDRDMQLVLRRANRWIETLALQNLAMLTVLRTQHTLTAGTDTLTIGPGGELNAARPDHFDRAGLVLDVTAAPTTEIPIKVFTDQEWQGIAQKSLESPLVRGVWYDRTVAAGLSTLHLWPVPNAGTTALVLYHLAPLSRFTTINDDVEFAPGYELYFQTNLLSFIAPLYGKKVSPDQRQNADYARRLVKLANIRPVEIGVDPGLIDHSGAAAFDIKTGDFR